MTQYNRIYIDRTEIIELTGVSRSQIFQLTSNRSSGFPEPAGTGRKNAAIWYRLDVLEFLKYWTPKTILDRNVTPNRVYGAPRGPYSRYKKGTCA
jgi:predicted DNA-binding transcriptional regulator AlpA